MDDISFVTILMFDLCVDIIAFQKELSSKFVLSQKKLSSDVEKCQKKFLWGNFGTIFNCVLILAKICCEVCKEI